MLTCLAYLKIADIITFVLGAVIGSIAGKFVCEILLGEDKKLAQQMEVSMQLFLTTVDEVYINVVNKINSEFEKIADLRTKAFDLNTNISITESITALSMATFLDLCL